MTTINGTAAIAHAARTGAQLHKHADPVEGARAVTLEEAREIARVDASLIYCAADLRAFHVYTANRCFYQLHAVTATDEDRARALAEGAANARRVLDEEAANAQAIGEEPPGEYRAYRIDAVDYRPNPGECVDLLDAGANG